MGVPKRRSSKSTVRQRRAHDHLRQPSVYQCPNCLEKTAPHRACVHCGYYKGRRMLKIGED